MRKMLLILHKKIAKSGDFFILSLTLEKYYHGFTNVCMFEENMITIIKLTLHNYLLFWGTTFKQLHISFPAKGGLKYLIPILNHNYTLHQSMVCNA